MKTSPAVVFVLALGVSFGIISGAGIGAEIFGQSPGDSGGLGPMDSLEQSGEGGIAGACDPDNSDCDNSLEGDVAGEDESAIIGFITGGGQFLITAVGSVVFLPGTLLALGFPSYFAIPFGLLVQFVASVGIIQFITGRQFI